MSDAGVPRPRVKTRQIVIAGTVLAAILAGWIIAILAARRSLDAAQRATDLLQILNTIPGAGSDPAYVASSRLLARAAGDGRFYRSTAAFVLVGTGAFTLCILVGVALQFRRYVIRHEVDEQLLRAALANADAANEAKTRFLANVSHEIRTPLNAVSGISGLLLETRLDTEQTSFARAVHSNAEALTTLIGDLLDSSRIEAGQVFLDAAPFDLHELVDGIGDILADRAAIKGLALILDLPLDGPRRLIGDRLRLRQVLTNLVGNAVKFTERGEVVVRVRLDAPAFAGVAQLRVSVIDTGIGIPLDAQAGIFQRFVQAERSTTRRYGGTGLGLNISRSLVELMGGRISFESQPDRGSSFHVDLALPIAREQPPAPCGPASLAGVDVMVIQANDTLREIVVRMLESAGASVRSMATAAEAFAQHSMQPARVIVAGERFSDSTGLEFARSLWRAHDGPGPAGFNFVLLCTLRSVAIDYVGSYGISDYLYKPVTQAGLVRAVRRAAGIEAEAVDAALQPAEAANAAHQAPLRILVAEDNRENWMLAEHILTSAGYAADLAQDGASAADRAAAFAYDLILMDIELPVLDGIAATRQIRAHEQATVTRRVPVIGLTAHAVGTVRQQALAAGMDAYVTKPFQKTELLDACRTWIDARPCLLVVDDAPAMHVLASSYLRGTEYRLVFAFNGREALDAFARQRVSLVLVDNHMPVMDGPETVRAIRQAPGGREVPIVALSGESDPRQHGHAAMDGCDANLTKPVQCGELLATVTTLLGAPADARRNATLVGAVPAALPETREATNQVNRLLALRDFDGLAALGARLHATGSALQLSALATVSDELVAAAHAEDVPRAEQWKGELGSALNDAHRLLDARRRAGAATGGPYDALARVATVLLGTPAASLTRIEGDEVHIMGGAGLGSSLDAIRRVPLERSLTSVIIDHRRPLLVEDVHRDTRLHDSPYVTAYGIVSCVGVPLIDAGGAGVGAFLAFDRRPRLWPATEVVQLEELARIAIRMFEMESLAGPAPPSAAGMDITVDDDIADLVPSYVAAQRDALTRLRELLQQGDFTRIGQQGHRMKGSGAGYGLPVVSEAGQELEAAARRGDDRAVRQVLGDLQAYLERINIRSANGRTVLRS